MSLYFWDGPNEDVPITLYKSASLVCRDETKHLYITNKMSSLGGGGFVVVARFLLKKLLRDWTLLYSLGVTNPTRWSTKTEYVPIEKVQCSWPYIPPCKLLQLDLGLGVIRILQHLDSMYLTALYRSKLNIEGHLVSPI